MTRNNWEDKIAIKDSKVTVGFIDVIEFEITDNPELMEVK